MFLQRRFILKGKRWLWILYIPLFLLLVIMFYTEMMLYSVLPPEQGGMSYWGRFKNIWYSSVSFYGIVLFVLSFLFYFIFRHKRERKAC